MYQADKYFTFHNIGDDSKVQIASFHMTGKALRWIRGLWRNKLLTTWDRFVEDLHERFGVPNFENKLEDLSRLQQSSMVADYLEKFEELLLNTVGRKSKQILITYFVGGLRPDIKSKLKNLWLEILQQAFAAAKVYEAHPGL